MKKIPLIVVVEVPDCFMQPNQWLPEDLTFLASLDKVTAIIKPEDLEVVEDDAT